MSLLDELDYLLKVNHVRPNKLKGQNFCIDQNVLDRMVEVAQLEKDDLVLEAGPGFGFLTLELLKKVKRVVAVELDTNLIKPLNEFAKLHNNLEIINKDILKLDLNDLKSTDYKIVANLPYSITSRFFKIFLNLELKPTTITVLIQKEVAERIVAKPGSMSLLAISIQLYGDPTIEEIVQKDSFYPVPKIDSAILHIKNIRKYEFEDIVSEKVFWQVVKSGFSAKRKQLHNNIKNSLHVSDELTSKIFNKSCLSKKIRAQDLKIGDWLKLAKSYQELFIDDK
ncbi:ribosomal RNA small subunit methyltransferase A [bacterium]|jgi:16S rRNA (adenine1518-N6/adenine1519-N6)-dimethyltransferase|nr:ribosomal RNA small subunit methyltransferase A [bacterium]MBT4122040.1 ribosomal RNA small subunit methyltransferase A [bacterium]MBT4495214.1 ribosomal RNA small subunit methyltransferase A [bacterium]MBT4763548.1 ribosomal RNA small subunit methyltransferase A [bacterium]MBT5400919.1 ribosomal RNA small subunit methyltransferase A [bacterium]